MKKLFILTLSACLLLSFCSCSKERTEIADYQYMYDGVFKDWKKHTDSYEGQENLLGFGEYLYNSELILFPRETPSTLQEFYYHWTPFMDVDGYAIYFTCELDANNYSAFAEELSNFEVQTGTESLKPIYDTEHFSLPTYILQWREVGKKWEVLEYIMLDEANRTAVFVYTMSELEFIEEHSSYTVTPTELHFHDSNFSIYNYIETGAYTDVEFESCTYDNSFLEYLK